MLTIPYKHEKRYHVPLACCRTRKKGIFKILIDRRRHGKLSESFAFKGVRFVVVVVVVDALLLLYVRNGAHQPIIGRLEEGGRKNDVSRFSEFSSALWLRLVPPHLVCGPSPAQITTMAWRRRGLAQGPRAPKDARGSTLFMEQKE